MGIEAEESIDLEQIAASEAAQDEVNEDAGGEEIQLTATEQEAFDQGWRPEEEFSGPKDNWKTAKEYVRDGKFLATIKELSQKVDNQAKDFDNRLDNSNKLHEARRKQEISSLKKEQREAVVMSDTDAYDEAQVKINDLEKVEDKPVTQPDTSQQDREIDEWNQKNTWFLEGGEKANDAKAFYNSYQDANPNATTEQKLKYIDKKINQLYPTENINPRRNQPNTTESPTRRGKQSSKSLSMGDLTSAEKSEFQQFGSMFPDEKSFLKAVSDTRAAS